MKGITGQTISADVVLSFLFPLLLGITFCVLKAKKRVSYVTVTWKVEHSSKINIHSHRRTTVENRQGLKCSYSTVFLY